MELVLVLIYGVHQQEEALFGRLQLQQREQHSPLEGFIRVPLYHLRPQRCLHLRVITYLNTTHQSLQQHAILEKITGVWGVYPSN